MRTFENALIDKLDVLAEAGRGDAAWRARFVTLCGALADHARLPGGTALVAAAARQLDALLQYRAAAVPHRLYLVSGTYSSVQHSTVQQSIVRGSWGDWWEGRQHSLDASIIASIYKLW